MRGGALSLCGSIVLLALAAPADAATGGAQPNQTTSAVGAEPTGGTVAAQAQVKPPGPPGIPDAVRAAMASANAIVGRPYVWGGGHRSFRSRGYDCSGAVSYLLQGGGLLASPLDSTSFMRWGVPGKGRWITVYTNPRHAFVEIGGRRLDTSAVDDPQGGSGPRWRPPRHSHAGYRARHPAGF